MPTYESIKEQLGKLRESTDGKEGIINFKSYLNTASDTISSLGQRVDEVNPPYSHEEMKKKGVDYARADLPTKDSKPLKEEQETIAFYEKLHGWDRDLMKSGADSLQRVGVVFLKKMKELQGVTRDNCDDKNYYTPLYNLKSQSIITDKIEKPEEGEESKNSLDQAGKEFREAKTALKKFRELNEITHPPGYNTFWLAFLFALIEGLGCGYFYSTVTDGYAQGFFMALVAGIIVVGFAWLAGVCLSRTKGYVMKKNIEKDEHKWVKPSSFYFVGVVVPLVFSLLIGIYLYLYRDSAALLLNQGVDIVAIDNQSLALAWERLWSPFDGGWAPQGAITSLALIFFSWIGIALGLREGFVYKDSIPGHVEKAKNLKTKRSTYKAEIRKSEKEYNLEPGQRQKFKKELENVRLNAEDINLIENLFSQVIEFSETVNTYMDEGILRYNKKCSSLLSTFREANKAERSHLLPAPDYFDDYPSVKGSSLDIEEEKFKKLKKEFEEMYSMDDLISTAEIETNLSFHEKSIVAKFDKRLLGEGRRNLDIHIAEANSYKEEVSQKDRNKEERKNEQFT